MGPKRDLGSLRTHYDSLIYIRTTLDPLMCCMIVGSVEGCPSWLSLHRLEDIFNMVKKNFEPDRVFKLVEYSTQYKL